MEARSESKGHYEETTSDSFGNYRLRGLLPGSTYVVCVVSSIESEGVGIDRASPKSATIHVSLSNIFIYFMKKLLTDITF